MGNVSQIYTLVNDAVSDFLGNTAVRAKDTSSFVDMGRSLSQITTQQNPYAGYDSFYGALAARIAKTEMMVKLYQASNRGVITDYQDFGAFVQRVYTDIATAVSNPAWSVSNGQNPPTITQHSPYDINATLSISAMIYGKRGTWSIEIMKPYKQIKEAFLNESSMMAFIDSIAIRIATSLAMEKESLENLAVATSIADCIKNSHATNVLAAYNTGATTPLTVANCRRSLDFLAFANKYISDFMGYIGKPSRKYNTAGYVTFTSKEDAKLEVLTDFASASKFYLESNTYHKELVDLPGYDEVPYWQSPGTSGDFSFAESSKVIVENEGIDADPVTGTGIIAFLRDKEQVKAYFGEVYTWEVPNPRDRVTNHGEQAETGYAVDPHLNAWVFYIAD